MRDGTEDFRARRNRAVAAIVSAARNDADLKQEDIAKELGVHRNLIGQIEAGEREMTIADLALFARLTKTTPAQLIDLITRWSSTLK